jgi:hypothetical protein
MTNINPLTIAGILGNALKSAIQTKFPPPLSVDVILKPSKVMQENTTDLQILIELENGRDIGVFNTTNFADLPNEQIVKIKEETYSIKLIAFTDDNNNNLAFSCADWLTSIFKTQKGKLLFQKNNIRVAYYSDIFPVATALDYENLEILKFTIKVTRFSKFNTSADYYDTFGIPQGYFDK